MRTGGQEDNESNENVITINIFYGELHRNYTEII